MIHKGVSGVSGRTRTTPTAAGNQRPLHAVPRPQDPDPLTVLPATLLDTEPGPARIRALNAYIAAGDEKVRAARLLRNADLRALAHSMGPTRAARAAEMTLATVKGLLRGSLPR